MPSIVLREEKTRCWCGCCLISMGGGRMIAFSPSAFSIHLLSVAPNLLMVKCFPQGRCCRADMNDLSCFFLWLMDSLRAFVSKDGAVLSGSSVEIAAIAEGNYLFCLVSTLLKNWRLHTTQWGLYIVLEAIKCRCCYSVASYSRSCSLNK